MILTNCAARLICLLGIAKPVKTSRVNDAIVAVKAGASNFYLIQKGDELIALDSGYAPGVIRRELAKLGIDPGRVSALFLSHTDFDHAGGLSVFPNAMVYLSRDEEPMVTKKTVRKYGLFYNKGINARYTLLKDNDEVDVGSIRVKAIETPGHTPGSMSYVIDGSVLFAGDAFRVVKQKARPVHGIFNMDKKRVEESLRKIAALEGIDLILTGHRGVARGFDEVMADWKPPVNP